MSYPLGDEEKWEEFWGQGIAPGDYFDASNCVPALSSLLSSGLLPRGEKQHALVPGCGRGYEVYELATSGLYHTVTGLDISRTGIEAAKSYVASQTIESDISSRIHLECADFFNFGGIEGGYALIFDYTFLCALPVEMREAWARKHAELIAADGILVTIMFPLLKAQEEGGPPFGLSVSLYEELLTKVGFVAADKPVVLPDALCHEGRGNGNSALARWIMTRK